ncbi:MAG: extracellular solute-binding protein [Anaerolineaceae bacterium]|nr:extracellular solute-binding protein [Anaerolineaceae bacterium]
MKKSLVTMLLIVVLAVTACTPNTAQPADQAAPSENQSAQAEGDVTTVRVWTHQNDSFNAGYDALAQSYMEEHPDVEIVFETFDYDSYIQTLQTALPAKTEADILQMFGSWVCSYADGGSLVAVPDAVLTMDDAKAQLFSATIGGYTCNDALYGIPQEFNIEYGAVLFNTATAAEVGATDYEDGWASWDEASADAQKMAISQDGVMTRAGFHFTGSDGIATMFHSLILQAGGEYLTDAGYSVDTAEGKAALELMQKLVTDGVVDPLLFNDEENWVGDSYFNGSTAIGLIGPWAVPEYSGDYPEVVETTIYQPLPSIGEEPVYAAASGWGLTVSANSTVQDAAWDFVQYVTLNADNAVEFNLASGTLPALQENISGANADKLLTEYPYFNAFLDILQYGIYEGHFPDRDFVWYEVTYPDVLNFLQGNATMEETLQTMDRSVQGSFE